MEVTISENQQRLAASEVQSIKCVVWDLDNTLWQGVLLEDKNVVLRPGIKALIEAIDARGILQSVASKNDYDVARQQLQAFDLWQYFLYPQINWNAKSHSLKQIAEELNIALDVFAFVDDQEFERDEVSFSHPMIETYAEDVLNDLLTMPRMQPKFITPESQLRRLYYQNDISRKQYEAQYTETSDQFLASLDMDLTVSLADRSHLQRAEELTLRTHQLNSTGYTYSYDELDALIDSPNHIVLVAQLDDRFGSYGTIGLALLEKTQELWTLKLLLMSCRVMSRGVGSVLLYYLMDQAKRSRVKLRAEFINNKRNRVMNITYKFSGFNVVEKQDDFVLYEHSLQSIPEIPNYLKLHAPEALT